MSRIEITEKEFTGFMYDHPYYFEKIEVGNELGFESHLGNDYYLQVLSSIPLNDNIVREDDAIRIHILHWSEEENSSTIVESESHTKRTPGFRDRVKQKIQNLVGCPECSERMGAAIGDDGPYKFCGDCNEYKSFD